MGKAVSIRLFTGLVAGFMLATVAGTLAHEGGHYIVARCLGYSAHINYKSTMWDPGQEFGHRDILLITWGGPLQTMLTGTLGFLLLLYHRRSFRPGTPLTFRQWVLIFLSLFWLRQLANLAVGIVILLRKGYMPHSGDETQLAYYHHWPAKAIALPTALAGALVLAVVVFRFIPRNQRILFLASGLVGGIMGYALWFYCLGPIMIP